jgi:uncharacterized protein (TIGR00288 family)
MTNDNSRHLLGVFLDFENLALGFRDGNTKFDIARVLDRLVEKGNIVVKRAYADWRRFSDSTNALQEAAFELLQIPSRRLTGKNSADMRLCVDIMDLCYSKAHVDTFVIVSGDSDFSPLVSKLKENGKTVIGLGMKASTSILLRDNCDEFIYYEDLKREEEAVAPAKLVAKDDKEREVFTLLLDSLKALQREGRDEFFASHIKDTMKRKSPSFNETYYGFKNFRQLLERAAEKGLVTVAVDPERRTHVVTSFGDEVRGRGSRRVEARSNRREEDRLEEDREDRDLHDDDDRSPRDERDLDDEPVAPPAPAKKKRRRGGRSRSAAAPKTGKREDWDDSSF